VKYGASRDKVLGLVAVTGTGDIVSCGGPWTKDATGYDLTHLLVGSEGTLAAGGTLGILIPPSVMLIVMGPVVGVPATGLFAAAVLPGLRRESEMTTWMMPRLVILLPGAVHPLPKSMVMVLGKPLAGVTVTVAHSNLSADTNGSRAPLRPSASTASFMIS